LVFILLTGGFFFSVSAAAKVVSVQSISISPYEKAIDGFAGVCPADIDRLLISDKHSEPLADRVRHMEPELILAVGLDALKAVEDIRGTPIVFVMLLSPGSGPAPRGNVTGVNMTPSVDIQLRIIRDLLPDISKIGVVFNPEQTGAFVDRASAAAGLLEMDILGAPVAEAREVPWKLTDIRDKVQIVWMLPDMTVMTRQTVEFFLLFSMENRIPLIAFSEKYVAMGAFMAFGLDPEDMGRQAGEMANLILSGQSPEEVPVQEARSVSVTINRSLMEKFDIEVDEEQLETVKFVE
jgi:putative ABC transport system substrate-binding protein